MVDSTPPRVWTSDCGGFPDRGGAAAANRRLAASSVGSISPDIDPPCVLARLGSRRPEHHGGVESIIYASAAFLGSLDPPEPLPSDFSDDFESLELSDLASEAAFDLRP